MVVAPLLVTPVLARGPEQQADPEEDAGEADKGRDDHDLPHGTQCSTGLPGRNARSGSADHDGGEDPERHARREDGAPEDEVGETHCRSSCSARDHPGS